MKFVLKKVSEIQKKEILKSFLDGIKIKQISEKFNFTVPTITRQLKKILGEEKFLQVKNIKTKSKKNDSDVDNLMSETISKNITVENETHNRSSEKEFVFNDNFNNNQDYFFEIPPLTDGVDLNKQKEISSVPIDNVELPNMLYMVVDKKIELETKLLKEFSEWQFLPQDDLNRKTIEIFNDPKIAKRSCNKEQKVIKVPNTNVFKIAAPFLISKGITRIVSDNLLIAL